MEVSAMIDLTRNRRKIFAFTGLFVLLLAAVLLLLPPEISPALGGGVGLEYRIHAVFNDEEEQQLAESSLIQTASDTLGLPVEGSLVPSAAQENLWLLQLRLDPTDEIPYDDFQDLTYALINSFPGWTFQTTAGISQSRGTAVRSTVDYLLCLIVLLGISALYLLLRCRRLQSSGGADTGLLPAPQPGGTAPGTQHRRPLLFGQEHGEKGKVIVEEKAGGKAVAFAQGVTQAAVDTLVLPQLAYLQLVPVGTHISKHQPAAWMAVIRKVMDFFRRIRRSAATASSSPAANPANPAPIPPPSGAPREIASR